jgi:NAD(P)-dependent dehydrogenase (short-subunit alcohol dehydrogenase family)
MTTSTGSEIAATKDVLKIFDLTGRTAVVTGGASGIGEATAKVLAGAGANVMVGDIDGDGAERTAKAIVADGAAAIALRTDVTQRADVDALVDRGVSEFGSVDVIANIAGIASDGAVADIDDAMFDKVMAITPSADRDGPCRCR